MAQQVMWRRQTGSRASLKLYNDTTDQAVLSQIEGTLAARMLWGDAAATSANLATGTNVTAVQIGVVGTTTTIPGNLTVQGTATSINTTNLTISDQLILLASGAGSGVPGGVAIERGATGDDALVLWSESNNRFELGLFDTAGGTVAPASLANLSDLAVNALNVGAATEANSTGDVAAGDAAATGLFYDASTKILRVGVQASPARITVPGVGASSEQFGAFATASGNLSVAVGHNAQATRSNTVAIGQGAQTTVGSYAVSIGNNAGAGGSNSYSIAIGYISDAQGIRSIAIGRQARGSGGDSIAIGDVAQATQTGAIAIGDAATCSASSGLAVGDGASATASGCIALGGPANAGHASSICLGGGATSTVTNQFVVGSVSNPITTVYFGEGVSSASPQALRVQGTEGSGTNIVGTTVTIRSGAGTGNSAVTSLIFQTPNAGAPGSVLQTYTTRLTLAETGVVMTAPAGVDLTLGARGGTITLNEVGQTALVGFTATSIVGALNELKSGTVAFPQYTNGNAGLIPQGAVVYISGTDTVDLADATNAAGAFAGNITQAMGLVEPVAGIASAASGNIHTSGVATPAQALLIAGLGAAAVGDEVFLAKTAGRITTDVTGYVTGDVVRSMGFIRDLQGYAGVEALVEIQYVPGPVIITP